MLKVFPCAKFIVNVRRDLVAQSRSAFWTKGNQTGKLLPRITSMLEHWQSSHTDRTRLLHLEDFTLVEFNKLLQWLGVRGCKFTVLAHSNYNGSYETSKT
mmetsp:Transcript_26439/g.54835  ORF Transcript_26439/g.54835 Transcript_26439/m.54835 type:complete len:100 (-) Transcript_26439:8-307(-)